MGYVINFSFMNNIYYQGYDIHTIKDICKDFFMNNITSIFFFLYTQKIFLL